MIQTKNLCYFKQYLINRFLYKKYFIEFPVLKEDDNNVNKISELTTILDKIFGTK